MLDPNTNFSAYYTISNILVTLTGFVGIIAALQHKDRFPRIALSSNLAQVDDRQVIRRAHYHDRDAAVPSTRVQASGLLWKGVVYLALTIHLPVFLQSHPQSQSTRETKYSSP